jgi:hypothetical protein
MSHADATSAKLAVAPLPEFLSLVIQAAGASDVEVVQSIAAFVNQSQRDEYVASAGAGDDEAGAALAAEYTSAACCTFQAAWEAFRKDRGGSKVRVLVFEGIIGQTGGRSGAHAGAAHCLLVVSGVEVNVLHVFEPFAVEWLRVKDMIPQSVGNLLADKAKTLTVKLVRGVTADDGTCRAKCAAFVAALALNAKEAVSGAVDLKR